MQFPKKLKVVEECSHGIANFEKFYIRKFSIPHEGIVTITTDGNIEILGEKLEKFTKISKDEGIFDEYRELINDRCNTCDRTKNFIKEYAALPVTATKIGVATTSAL